ncbi:MAG: carotenoid biosynthesis protein [candidate division WOR-3 bacterium]
MHKDTYNSKTLTVGIWFMLAATAALMVANLVVRPPLNWLRLIPVYTLAAFTLLHGFTFFGIRRTLWFLALGLVVSYVAEYLGTNFGAIFGTHWFSRVRDLRLPVGVMLPGRVPLAVVLTWYGMLYATFLTAVFLVKARPSEPSPFATVPIAAGMLMALWQLTAGPVAVAWGLMGFVNKGFYHSVPLSSFVGWSVTTMFILLFFMAVEPEAANTDRFHARISSRPIPFLPLVMFGLQLLYGTVTCFLLGFNGAAWLGTLVLVLYLLAIAVSNRKTVPDLKPAENIA